jgi:hypothetical protein
MGALRSYETYVLTKATWRYIPEDGILQITITYNLFELTLALELEFLRGQLLLSLSSF